METRVSFSSTAKIVTRIAGYGNFLPGPDDGLRLLVFYSFASLLLFPRTIYCSYLIRSGERDGEGKSTTRKAKEKERESRQSRRVDCISLF